MWPWDQSASSNQSFQPPAAFQHQHVHHVTPPAPLHPVISQGANAPSPYVGYQPQHFTTSVNAASGVTASTGGTELSHSHPGIGYGIPGMSSLSVPSPWNQEQGHLSHQTNVISPHSTDSHSIDGSIGGVPGTSPVPLAYHSPHEELSAGLSHLGGPRVSPTSYVTPPPNAADTPSPTIHQTPPGQAAVLSPNPAFAPPTAPPPSQPLTGTPPHHSHSLTPPQPHSYPSSSPGAVPQAQHIHSSSPFSVDYLLRGDPPPNVVETGSYVSGSGRNDMRQEIPTGGWSLFEYMYVGVA